MDGDAEEGGAEDHPQAGDDDTGESDKKYDLVAMGREEASIEQDHRDLGQIKRRVVQYDGSIKSLFVTQSVNGRFYGVNW